MIATILTFILAVPPSGAAPQINWLLITLLAGGTIVSNFYDFVESLLAGNWLRCLQQLFNLGGILGVTWLYYFQPLLPR